MALSGNASSGSHYLLTPILLEQNITHLSQGPSPFHRHVKVLREDPAFSKDLIAKLRPPETLCRPSKSLKEYKNASLAPQNLLFAPLHKAIELLQTTIFSSKKGQEASQKIIELYQSYIQEVCAKIGKERMALLKGPAYFLGIGDPLLLDRKIALDLTSLDTYGQSAKSNAYGSSAVKKIGDVYFKRVAAMNPLCPGMEFAVDSLNKILMEEGSTPTQLIKIQGIWIRAVLDESNRAHESQKLFAKELAIGTPSREFFVKHPELKQDYPFKEKRITQITQASHAIQGINLLEFLEHKENLSLIDPYNFSVMSLLGVCISPSDGRSDNYMVVKQKEKNFKAIGIDNDQAFTPFFLSREDKHYLNLRYAFFLFPQMNEPLNPRFCKRLEKAKPELLLLEWIAALAKKNAFYQNLRKTGTLNRFEFEDLGLPITLSYSSIQRIYQSLLQAKDFVKQSPNATHWELLSHLSPHIALIYQKLIVDSQGDILAAQEKLFNRKKDPIAWETFFGENPPLPPPVEPKETPPKRPLELLLEWVESLDFPSSKEQGRFLDKLFLAFPDLEKLKLSNCVLEDRSFVEIFTRVKDLQELKIENFPRLTAAGLFPLLQEHPNLHLILGEKHTLKAEELAELIHYAWDRERNLSIQLGSKIFSFNQDNLDPSLIQMLEGNHLLYAEALCRLGADVNQKDKNGNTLLHQFADKDPKTLRFLLEKGLSPHEVNKRREMPLHIAAQKGSVEHIQMLVQHGVLLEEKDLNGKTPLHFAAIAGQEAIAQYLLEKGANFEALSNEKENVLHFAITSGCIDLVEYFLSEISASISNQSSSSSGSLDTPPLATQIPSFGSWLRRDSKSLSVSNDLKLRSKGSFIGTVGDHRLQNTPLRSLLNQKDADGKTPLHKAVWGDPKPEIVDLLLQQRVDPNIRNHYGYTPLHWAAKHGHLESIKLLLAHQTDYTILNTNGDTPLDLAIKWGQDEVFRLFLMQGMPVSKDPQVKPLSPREEGPSSSGSHDAQGDLYLRFENAYESNDPLEQLLCLEKMATNVEEKDLMQAAHLLNAALYHS